MGKPRHKNKDHKNKSKRDNLIMVKNDVDSLGLDEMAFIKKKNKKIDECINANFHPTECEWITDENFTNSIINFIKEKIKYTNLGFSTIFEIGLENGWNFEKMDDRIEFIIKNINPKLESSSRHRHKDICSICTEEKEEFYSLECGHEFCLDCFRNYISILQKENGPSLIRKTCPMEGCKVIISFDCYEQLYTKEAEEFEKYKSFLKNFFLATKEKNIKQCPFENCNHLFKIERINISKEIICPSGHAFCAKCKKMPHPIIVSCKRLKHINMSYSSTLSVQWIATNSKKCPRCSASIEKNMGCDHMTCRYCGNEFCWLCLSAYKGHSIGGLECKEVEKVFLKRREELKEKARLHSEFVSKFSSIYSEYIENIKAIENKRKKLALNAAEILTKYKITSKNKKKAENLVNFIFENLKSVAFMKEVAKLLEVRNHKLEENINRLEQKTNFFSNAFSSLKYKGGIFEYFTKTHYKHLEIQMILKIKEDEESLRNYLSTI